MAKMNNRKGIEKVEYLFVDAGYLTFRLKDWAKHFDDNEVEINFSSFVSRYDKVFYYDGVSESDIEKKYLLNKLRELPNFHVFTGTVKGEGKKRRQKQVDVLIAVNMLTHTIRNNMDSCTLLAGDEDFKPLIDALIQEGMNVTIWAEKKSVNKDLLYSADKKRDLSLFDVWECCTEDFRKKYPVPAINKRSLMQNHQTRYKASGVGKIGKWNVFKQFIGDGVLLVIDSSGESDVKDIYVKNDPELERCLKILGYSIKWEGPVQYKLS